ncbi:hypothetical protein [Bradyrhizobium sp.]|uniref:hypothetical protein n=1 Tax=Bradyrhizobium sp. TaxID=376 RepID=UPI001D1D6FE9|nr:hypothetical protein [Bradyrhizobium sp.]MBI5321595.1 hypothetical protein [Bradyrhizobium sp.]
MNFIKSAATRCFHQFDGAGQLTGAASRVNGAVKPALMAVEAFGYPTQRVRHLAHIAPVKAALSGLQL